MDSLLRIEESILMFIQENLRTDWLNPIFKLITFLGNVGWFWILLTVVFLAIPQTRRTGAIMAISAIVDVLLVNLIMKNLFARTRPYILFESLVSLVGEESDFSFPSGHSAISFAVATVILLCLPKRLGIPAIILASLIALSRLYVGVHYPTDVIAGVAVGIACAFIARLIFELLEKRLFPIKKQKT